MKKKTLTLVTAMAFLCVALHTTPCQAFLWPTFDIAEVLNTISGYVTKAKSTASTIDELISSAADRQLRIVRSESGVINARQAPLGVSLSKRYSVEPPYFANVFR